LMNAGGSFLLFDIKSFVGFDGKITLDEILWCTAKVIALGARKQLSSCQKTSRNLFIFVLLYLIPVWYILVFEKAIKFYLNWN
jgi:hypothetical protein